MCIIAECNVEILNEMPSGRVNKSLLSVLRQISIKFVLDNSWITGFSVQRGVLSILGQDE